MNKYCILFFLNCLICALSAQVYGPFIMSTLSAESCKGPKRKNCTDIQLNFYGDKLSYYIHVKENTIPKKGKVVGVRNGVEAMTLQIKSFCDHLFLRPLINNIFNVTNNCVILKGDYNFTVDLQDIAQKYHGGAFLYGNWAFKSVFFNDECNFDCLITKFKVSPRNKRQ